MSIFDKISKMLRHESEAEKLYRVLNTDEYKERPYEYSDLGEGMAVIGETMWGWWKHRFYSVPFSSAFSRCVPHCPFDGVLEGFHCVPPLFQILRFQGRFYFPFYTRDRNTVQK